MRFGFWGASTAALVFIATPTWAQQSTSPAKPGATATSDADQSDRSEIIVTGQRAEDNVSTSASLGVLGDRGVLETPFAIDGYGRGIIENTLAITLSDVLKNDPSVTVVRSRGSFNDTPNVRGFPIGGGNLLYDGQQSAIQGGAIFQLEAIERVDLLQGPAAFFYGAAAFGGVGGAVNYIPKRAVRGRSITEAELQFIEPGYVSGRVDISRRFGSSQDFGARFNGAYGDGTMLVDHTDTQRAVADLALDWQPSGGGVRVFADLAYVRNIMNGYQNNLTPASVALLPTIPKAPDGRNTMTQPWAHYPTELFLGVLKAEVDLAPDWTLTVSGGRSHLRREIAPSPGNPTLLDAAGDTRMAASYATGGNYDNLTFDASLRGKFVTGPLTHSVTIAADRQTVNFETRPTTVLAAVLSNIYNPIIVARPPLPATQGPVRRTFDSAGYGMAASDIVDLGDSGISALIGGRYSSFTYNQYNGVTGVRTSRFDDGRLNPIGALMWKPSESSILYANYSEAFERGGTAPAGTINANEVLAPLKTNSYEAGAKAEFAGLTFQFAAFRIEKGLEYIRAASVVGQPGTYVQDGRQIHKGAEFQVSGSPLPGLFMTGGVMVLDPRVHNTADPANEGNRPQGVPRFQGTLYGSYQIPDTGFGINGGLYHYARQFVDLSNARTIPAWTRLDLGGNYSFDLDGAAMTARIAVENVTDHKYWASSSGGSLAVGAARTFKASLTVALQ